MRKTCILLASVLLLVSGVVGTAMAVPEKVVIGIIPEVNLVKQMDRYTPLIKYLTRKTGMEIIATPVSTYGRIYEKMRDNEIDAGFFGSFVYTMTRARIGIEPLVRPQKANGVSTYAGMTFVRKDSGIRRPEDMRGKTIALVDPSTTGGYIAQKEYLDNHGIDLDRDLKIIWVGNHDEVVTTVMKGEAQIGGAKNNVVNKIRKENAAFDKTLTILDETPKRQVPENTLAVRKGLKPETVAKLKNTLLKMHQDPEGQRVLAKFGAARFIPTSDADYASLYELVRHLKIDLATYPYRSR
jgi:phosphonate transport system substrate-binding protein